jgi:hypothetical protein
VEAKLTSSFLTSAEGKRQIVEEGEYTLKNMSYNVIPQTCNTVSLILQGGLSCWTMELGRSWNCHWWGGWGSQDMEQVGNIMLEQGIVTDGEDGAGKIWNR